MKIFITGVAGFLGSHVADKLLDLGHTVHGCDNLTGGYLDNVSKNVKFYKGDCCNLDFMVAVTKDIDIIVHTAATPHEGLSIFSPYFITTNVFQASVSTISAAIQNKVKKFIYCSSMARYGSQEYPFVETQTPSPIDPYGIAKVAGEEVLKTLASLNKMDYIIAVPHNIVGPRQRYDDPFRNVMSIMINRCLQGKPPIIYGDGSQKRCFSYIGDSVFCLEKLILDKTIKNDIFNIGPDEEFVSIKELAELVIKELKFVGDPIYFPDRPREVKYATCSAEKARKELGYRTKTSLVECIHETAEYIKKRGAKPFDYTYPLEYINDKTPKTWSERLM